MEIGFVHRPIGVVGDSLGIGLNRTPKATNPAVEIVDRFDLRLRRPSEEHSAGATEWFHKVTNITKIVPDDVSYTGLAAEPRPTGTVRVSAPFLCHLL